MILHVHVEIKLSTIILFAVHVTVYFKMYRLNMLVATHNCHHFDKHINHALDKMD